MTKQNVNIVNFDLLYEILDEIKENLSFNILKYENENDVINEENENFEKLETSTTTHAGTLSQGSRIVYSQSRISLILSLTDNKSGRIVWSKSTWYSGLELQRTINMCLKDGVNELRKIIR